MPGSFAESSTGFTRFTKVESKGNTLSSMAFIFYCFGDGAQVIKLEES
jgi:hypothetical protein